MRVKTFLTVCGILPLCLVASQMPELNFDPPPRIIKMDQKNTITLTGKNFEIVVPDDAGLPAKFAGKELQMFLNKVLSAQVPLNNARSKNTEYAIILGDNALSRKAGIKVDKLTRDGFIMKTLGKEIYIAGRDDKASDTEKLLNDRSWKTTPIHHHRATLFGVYDFLERFADIRFYFVGPIGTIVPQKTVLKVPALDIFDRPDNTVRRYTVPRFRKENWYQDENPVYGSNLNRYRVRMGTWDIPNCHGIAYLGYIPRFGASNPEFFALKKDGTRYNTWNDDFPGQICLTNPGFRNELFKDAVSALKGEPPTTRGVRFAYKKNQKGHSMWSPCVYAPGFFNVHLQDGCQPCLCDNCQKLLKPYVNDQPSGEWVWDMTADIANRVKKAGFKAYITQMAYHFYREVPKTELPDNVLVQVATAGPWASNSKAMDSKDRELLKAWNRKLGKKVWLWNYVINGRNPASRYNSAGAPHYSPKTIGRYYQVRRNEISGAFMEGSRDNNFAQEAMNYYVAMKLLWNTSLDVDALMAEYYQFMFKSAASEMQKFFEDLEDLWIKKMRGQYIDTDLGPVSVKPTEYETWKQIYTPAKLKEWENLFKKAEKKVARDKETLARIQFMRKNFLAPVQEFSKNFLKKEKRANQLIAYAAPAGQEKFYYLSRMNGGTTDIKVGVSIQNAGDAFIFKFRADDPKTSELIYNPKKGDLKEFFYGATFEIFLNPSNDRKNILQIAVAPAGTVNAIHQPGIRKFKDARIQADAKVAADHWTVTVRVPFALMPEMNRNGFFANFSYNRQRKNTKSCSELYTWSPWIQRSFLEADNYGQISLNKPANRNLIKEFDFEGVTKKNRIVGKEWRTSVSKNQNDFLDLTSESFISGGQSLKIVGNTAKSVARLEQSIKNGIEPNTKYRFSYYVRYDLDKNAVARGRAWLGGNHFYPAKGIRGKQDGWVFVNGEFKTGNLTPEQIKKSHIGFSLNGKGTIYFDHIILEKVD